MLASSMNDHRSSSPSSSSSSSDKKEKYHRDRDDESIDRKKHRKEKKSSSGRRSRSRSREKRRKSKERDGSGSGSRRRDRSKDRKKDHRKRDRSRSRSRDRDRDRDRSNDRYHRNDKKKQKHPSSSSSSSSSSSHRSLDDLSSSNVYIPPHRLRALKAQQKESSNHSSSSPSSSSSHSVPSAPSLGEQRLAWEALRKSINGIINRLNNSNIAGLLPLIFEENLVRGRGLFCRSIMKAEEASPSFAAVYSAFVAVINTKIPEIGELLLKRLIIQFNRSYKRSDKSLCLSTIIFLSHLFNQSVLHEIIPLQILSLLLESPTSDSVELAVEMMKILGKKLGEISSMGLLAVFERLRTLLMEGGQIEVYNHNNDNNDDDGGHISHDHQISKRTQYLIESLFQMRKSNFSSCPPIPPELDLVELDDQITHELSLEENYDEEKELDFFKYDADYNNNELLYQQIKAEILGEGADDDEQQQTENNQNNEGKSDAMDTEQTTSNGGLSSESAIKSSFDNESIDSDTRAFRRSIYLTIMSSLSHEEAAHKLLKLMQKNGKGREGELCNMIIECCAAERSYLKTYGEMGEKFCRLSRTYQEEFEELFARYYLLIHRFDTNRIRNFAKFFAHLLYTNAIDWNIFIYLKITEDDTTSAGRIFMKNLFRELSELLGLYKLKQRLESPLLEKATEGLFPRDSSRNLRFSINFFTSIGLGGLTERMREWLKDINKSINDDPLTQLAQLQQQALKKNDDEQQENDSDDDDEESSSSSSDSDSSSSDSDSDSDSDDSSSESGSDSSGSDSSSSDNDSSDEEDKKEKKQKKHKKEKNSAKKESNEGKIKKEENDNEEPQTKKVKTEE